MFSPLPSPSTRYHSLIPSHSIDDDPPHRRASVPPRTRPASSGLLLYRPMQRLHAHTSILLKRSLPPTQLPSPLLQLRPPISGIRSFLVQNTTLGDILRRSFVALWRGGNVRPGAWDPPTCLEFGERFFRVVKEAAASVDDASVWRATFTPGEGVSVRLLDQAGVEEVVNEEDRVGLLPRWYWDELVAA
ncbi:hypothetical protein NMY22_g18822 [Coprinellus aureogranulatus]|nr:hypothetical protein NMY22_g18822 [Coprinellus aureogranulatus]